MARNRRPRSERRTTRFINFLRDIRFYFLCLIGRRQRSGVKIVVTEPTPLPSPPSELSSSSSSSSCSSDDTYPIRLVTLSVASARERRGSAGCGGTARVSERQSVPSVRQVSAVLEKRQRGSAV